MSAHPIEGVSVRDFALRLYDAHVLAFPATADRKHPVVRWAAHRYEPSGWPERSALMQMFAAPGATRLFIVCGERSGGVGCMDFDQPHYFEAWAALVSPDLLTRLYIEQSQRSGGYHVAFKVRGVETCVPARDARNEEGHVGAVRIEVRGEGNGFIAAPSAGYQWIQGDLTNLPALTDDEYASLTRAAESFNECEEIAPPAERVRAARPASGDELPGTRYNRESGQAQVLDLFRAHGYTIGLPERNGNVPITRPGATSETSGNVNPDGVLHMFSTNTPFVPSVSGKGNPHTPFAAYTWLEHGGDYAAAGKALYRQYNPTPLRVVRGRMVDEDTGEIRDPLDTDLATDTGFAFPRRALLGDLLRGGIEAPQHLVPNMLLRGHTHTFAGEPGCGKTNLLLWASLGVIAAGENVLFLDEEGGERQTAERLIAFGAEPETVDRHLFYLPFPAYTNTEPDVRELHAYMRYASPALVVVDSLADFMALASADENNAMDVTTFLALWIIPAAREYGAAVALLDHTTIKAAEESNATYARGSGAKKAKMDVLWMVKKTHDYSRDVRGRIEIVRRKDRTGILPPGVKFVMGGDGQGGMVCIPEGFIAEQMVPPRTFSDATWRCLEVLSQSTGLRWRDWLLAIGGDNMKGALSNAKNALAGAEMIYQGSNGWHVTPEGREALKVHGAS